MKTTVKIYTAFSSEGLFGSTDTYPLHHPNQRVLSNEDMLNEIRQRCEGVEFVGTTEVEEPDYTMANVLAQGQSLDGLLYFGHLVPELVQIALPTLAVYPLWGQWQEPFEPYKGNRVLTSTLPIIPDASAAMFSSRLETIAERIKLIQIIARMKGLRILCITDVPILGKYEPGPYQMGEEGRRGYERTYLGRLADMGVEIVVRPQQELVSRLERASEAEAEKVASEWIAEAEGMKGTNEAEVKESAKLYLAMKEMLDEYDADAITTEGYGVFMDYPGGPIPSQGLPSSHFCTDGIVATSETLVDSLITQQLGLWMTGNAGFNGDYIIDVENNKAYIGHCECPLNPYGDACRAPHVIRNLPQWPVDEQEKGGACVQVRLPVDEPVTVAKVSVYDRKLALFTGRAVAGEQLFPGWDDLLCRTKLAIDVDAARIFNNVDWRTFGWHRVVFYGDYRGAFKDLAALLGYEAIEKDK